MALVKTVYNLHIFVFIFLVYTVSTIAVQDNSIYTCEGETLHITCDSGTFIEVKTALYGRLENGLCTGVNDHVTSCSSPNALKVAQDRCTGKQTCTIDANNEVFGDPCSGTRKYLQVEYYCVQGTCQEFHTTDEYKYTFLGPLVPRDAYRFAFSVRANNDAHVALSSHPYDEGPGMPDDFIEIVIGGWNNAVSEIRKCKQCPGDARAERPNILSPTEDRHFLISYQDNSVTVSVLGEDPLMAVQYDNLNINYIGISTGWGSSGNWTICNYVPAPVFLGCFQDAGARAVPNHLMEDPAHMTVDKCVAYCRSFGDQKYAAVQYHYQCFCGNAMTNYSVYGQTNQNDCNAPCRGDDKQFCGGAWRNSVYDLGAPKNIRLVGGENYYSGRVELFHNGSWSTVCGLGWDPVDADVACKAIGFPGATESYANAEMFGPGVGDIILSSLHCVGTETDLFECRHWNAYYVTDGCSHEDDVGVVCRQWPDYTYDHQNNGGGDWGVGQKIGVAAGVFFGLCFLNHICGGHRRRNAQNQRNRPTPAPAPSAPATVSRRASAPEATSSPAILHVQTTTNSIGGTSNTATTDNLPSYESVTETSSVHGFPDVIPPYQPDMYNMSELNSPDLPPPPSYEAVVDKSEDYRAPDR